MEVTQLEHPVEVESSISNGADLDVDDNDDRTALYFILCQT